MKVLAINGSPRKEGNTAAMLNTVLDVAKEGGAQTEFYQAGGKPVMGCLACGSCRKNTHKCVTDDWINELYPKMLNADAILIGSPTYFADLTPETKAVIDRCGYIARSAGSAFSRKIGAAISAVRRAGGIHTLDSIQHFFTINDMIIPGSSYWNMSLSRDLNDFQNDNEGIATMKRLAENILWLGEKIG
ncbi:MAG: flavodoxin family protein [Defluviitaleaceae bacterium]|nr:flavodoxin family protein [Defluviitaleaceae bacterium]MCL2262011.1 flavodoxin family protein [Defluviitaleaceae bacterium]